MPNRANQEAAAPVIVRNTLYLLATYGTRLASGLLLTVLLVRSLGPASYGQFAFAIAVGTQLLFLGDLGLNLFIKREIARAPDRSQPLFRRALRLSLASTAVGVLLSTLVAVVLGRSSDFTTIALGTLYVAMSGWLALESAVLHAHERMGGETEFTIVERVVGLAIAALAVWMGAAVTTVLLALVLGRLAAIVWVYFRHLREWLASDPGEPTSVVPPKAALLWIASPFALNVLATSIYQRIDVILISVYHGDLLTGFYTAAKAIVIPLGVVAAAVSTSFFPRLARAYAQGDKVVFKDLIQHAFEFVMLAAVVIAMCVYLLATLLTQILYGHGFGITAEALQVFALSVPIVFANNIFGSALTALDRQKNRALAVAVGAIFNIVAGVLLIPQYSVIGAAVAAVATEVVIFLLLLFLMPRAWAPRLATARLLKLAVITAVAFGSAAALGIAGRPTGLAATIAIFVAGVLLTRVYSPAAVYSIVREMRAGLR